MGKTVVCISLILANPCRNPITPAQASTMRQYILSEPKKPKFTGLQYEMRSGRCQRTASYETWDTMKQVPYQRRHSEWLRTAPAGNKKLKLTLIYMPCSLLGQWRDEIHKFAPNLKVRYIDLYRHVYIQWRA